MTDIVTDLVWLYGEPQASGLIKQSPEDFVVSENLGYQLDGEGEHLFVRVRKKGCNTQYVAEQLAKFAKTPARSVSYAGLKDRQAVTEQWFCLHLPGKETPDFSQFQLEGCQILALNRHRKKLRIGNLQGNAFSLIIRQIDQPDLVEQRLKQIAQGGAVNYFGEQRFGKNGNNLIQAQRWANDEIKVRERQKRSFYLSAVRSALFNAIVSARIEQQLTYQVVTGDALQLAGRGSWFVAQPDELELAQQRVLAKELRITAPLPGCDQLGSQGEALLFEQQCLSKYHEFLSLLERERVESARRAILVYPQQLNWQWLSDHALVVNFTLPAGSFATSVIRELIKSDIEQLSELTE